MLKSPVGSIPVSKHFNIPVLDLRNGKFLAPNRKGKNTLVSHRLGSQMNRNRSNSVAARKSQSVNLTYSRSKSQIREQTASKEKQMVI